MSDLPRSAKKPRWQRMRVLVITLAAAIAVAVLWSWYEPALRGFARGVVESQLASLLTGEVQIDKVDALDFGSVSATGVRIVDARGRVVLTAQHLELDYNLYELAQGRLRFTRGHIRDASIHAYASENAVTTLFEALIPKESSDGGPSALEIFFDNLHIENATLHGNVPGLSGIEAESFEIRGHIAIRERFEAKLERISGKLTGPFALPFEVQHATTHVLLAPLKVTTFARLRVNEDNLHVAMTYEVPEAAEDQLELVVVASPATSDLLSAFNLSIASSVISKFEGSARLQGPLNQLRYSAALKTDGGPLVFRGTLAAQDDLTVHVETDGLALADVLAYFPPVRIAVSVDAKAPKEGPITLNAHAPWLDVFGVPIENVDLAGRYAAGRFDIDSLLAFYAGGRFKGNGWVDENADGKLHIRSDVPDAARAAALKNVRVAITTDAVLEKHGEALSFDGSLGLQKFSYEGATFRELHVQGRASVEDDYEKPTIRLKGRAAELSYGGYRADRFDFSVQGKLGRYAADFAVKDAQGRALGGHVDITQRASGIEIRANPFELSVQGREPWRAQADLLVDAGGIEFRQLLLASGAQRLNLSGKYSFTKAYRVQGTVQSFDLGGLRELSGIDLADLDGTIDGTLTLSGVPGQPRIDANGSLRHGVFLGMTDLTVLLTLVFLEGRFDIESELQLNDGSSLGIYAGGTPGPGRDFSTQVLSGNYQFGLDFQNVPFQVSEPWLAWVGLHPPKGTISATLRGAGTLDDPIVDIKTEIRGIELYDLPPLDLDVDVVHDGQRLDIRELSVADAQGSIATLTAELAVTPAELTDPRTLRKSLASREFTASLRMQPRRIDSLPKPFAVDVPVIVGGTASILQSPEGPKAALTVDATWPDAEAGLGACTLVRRPALKFEASATGQETVGKLSVHLDRETIATGAMQATIPLSDWLTGKAEFALPNMDLELHANTGTAEELPLLCEYVAGPLKVDLSAKDFFGYPPNVTFVVESPALQLVPNGTQTSRLGNLRDARATGRPFALRFQGALAPEQIEFAANFDLGRGSKAALSGTIPRQNLLASSRATAPPLEADLVFTHFEVAPVLLALPIGARVSGQIDGRTHVTYHVAQDQLSFDGALAFSNGQLGLSALGQELDEVEAQLKLKGNWIRIDNLSARDFEGKIRAEGNVIFEKATQLRSDFALRLTDFPIRQEGALVSSLSGRLNLRAEIDKTRTRSELHVVDLRVSLPKALATSLQSLDSHPSVFIVGSEPAPPPKHPYLFELHFVADAPPFRVLGTGLSAEVLADLDVRYQAPQLSVEGSAELKRGDIDLYGKRFELRESRMAFDANSELDPIVTVYAVHKVGGDEIGVRVDGRLSDPQVSFTHSDPSVTDTGEIIARLLGTRTDDFARQNTDASGAAAGILAGATAGLLTEEVRKEFGGAIPVLSLESRTQSMKTTRIRAGVQLDQLIEKRLGALRHVVRGAYIEGFVAPGADPNAVNPNIPPQSRGGGLLELRFPADMVGTVEYRPVQNWRLDVAWEP